MTSLDEMIEDLAKKQPNNPGVIEWRKAKRAHARAVFIARAFKVAFWGLIVGFVAYCSWLVLWMAN